MRVELEYPPELAGEPSLLVRLVTAIHIACLDSGGGVFGLKYSDDELQVFDVPQHRYYAVKPVGNIRKAVSLLTKSVLDSVDKGDLKLKVERRSIFGELSLENSWVSFDDFSSWCETRSITLGDAWFEFYREESRIIDAGLSAAEVRRQAAEGYFGSVNVDDLRRELESDGISSILDEVEILRAKVQRLSKVNVAEERPVATAEKNTLLKLVIGMAVRGYGYDPKASKSPCPAQIASDINDMGIGITDDTVRKYLKEAAKSFLSLNSAGD